MNRQKFKSLFLRNIERARPQASEHFKTELPKAFEIELHGAGSSGHVISFEEAADRLYMTPDRFYRIIDVAVKRVRSQNCIMFVRSSDHTPSAFKQTLNRPKGNGPFNVLLPMRIEVEE